MHITTLVADPRTLFSHVALHGLGAILESQGVPDVRLGWTRSGNPRPFIATDDLNDVDVATLVKRHAEAHATNSWVQRDMTLKGAARGLMSPRLTPFGDDATWAMVQRERHAVLDKLTSDCQWLDLRFVAALGEPCYWSFNRQGALLQDDGASRLEMQPRNQGSEFVGSRLRKLAPKVANREPDTIAAGLRGESVIDEIGNDKPDSRTPTGLATPGPADNALAWCALWGISQYPIGMRINETADTSGHLSRERQEWFYAPIWRGLWRPARLRTILASRYLRLMAADGLPSKGPGETDVTPGRAWLGSRGVEGVVRFPIHRFGSDSAPERRAMRGELIPVSAPP
ncbi:MAG: hypothetical protein ABSA93_40305 [Streptosporangiaceae bacterium]